MLSKWLTRQDLRNELSEFVDEMSHRVAALVVEDLVEGSMLSNISASRTMPTAPSALAALSVDPLSRNGRRHSRVLSGDSRSARQSTRMVHTASREPAGRKSRRVLPSIDLRTPIPAPEPESHLQTEYTVESTTHELMDSSPELAVTSLNDADGFAGFAEGYHPLRHSFGVEQDIDPGAYKGHCRLSETFRPLLVADIDELCRSTQEARQDPPSWSFHDLKSLTAEKIVENPLFDKIMACTVVLNAVALGFSTNFWAIHHQDPAVFLWQRTLDAFFLVMFSAELCIRIKAYKCVFFYGEGFAWNIFDTVLVTSQLVEVIPFGGSYKSAIGISPFRMVRVLRVLRVTRLLKAVHIFDDLRVIVSSILSSLSSLCWSVALLMLMIYVFSLIIMQMILHSGQFQKTEELRYYFPNVGRTFLTLFEAVVGGLSWDAAIEPLFIISPCVGILFCFYVAIALFAMMNMLTGVFCDQAMRVVREDRDAVVARRIAELFIGTGDGDDEITWSDFEAKLNTPAMEDYFKQINVDVSEGRSFFELLDADGSGSLDGKEMVTGCLRLRGFARALDVAMLDKQIVELRESVDVQTDLIYKIITALPPREEN